MAYTTVQIGTWMPMTFKIEDHIGLIQHLVAPYAINGVDIQDLVQEGYLGYVRAIETFDPNKGFRFNTYAGFWIKKYAREWVNKEIKHRQLVAKLAPETSPLTATLVIDREEEYGALGHAMLTLDLPALMVLLLRFGFGSLNPYTYKKIGQFHGKSIEWARQQVMRSLQDIKDAYEGDEG